MIALDGQGLTPAQLHRIAHGEPVELSAAAAAEMRRNAAAVPPGPSALERKRRWLLGDFARDLDGGELCRAFILGHCAGVGEPLPAEAVRALIAARANVLAGARTGSRPEAAQALLALLVAPRLPAVPSQGSVGAAGDLAPLAHVARAVCGYGGENLIDPPLRPTPEEALALINGATLATALAALAVVRARRVLVSAIAAATMTMEALGASTAAFDPRPLAARGQEGGLRVAAQVLEALRGSDRAGPDRPPDAFSIRCIPAVLGAAWEALEGTERVVTRELNAAASNPLLIDGTWIEAGNFHGAPIALAMDHLRIALTSVAAQSERRTFRLSNGQLSAGLPSFLVEGTGLNSGFMLAQYTAASLVSECKGLCFPASVDSIPTVQHQEDHVSMGPIAARQALQVVENAADVVAIEALLAAQALDLRARGGSAVAPAVDALRAAVRAVTPFWEDDGLLHAAMRAVGLLLRGGGLSGAPGRW